jgi:hypothetical protein
MTVELKQAAQQVLDAFEAFGEADDFATLFTLTQKMNALRTAIQQAEAKTDEPVAWGWAIVDNKGLERRTHARLQDFFGSTQEAKPFSLEDVAREDREFAGCAPHRVITLFTHLAPGVPEDVTQDAQRYRWLRRKACVIGKTTYCGEETGQPILDFVNLPDVTEVIRRDSATTLDAAIDAAMLIAKEAK